MTNIDGYTLHLSRKINWSHLWLSVDIMTRFWSVGYASATLVLVEWLVIKPAPQLDQQINGLVVIVLKWAIMAANFLLYLQIRLSNRAHSFVKFFFVGIVLFLEDKCLKLLDASGMCNFQFLL